MQLDINREPKKINQQYINKMEQDSETRVITLAGGLKGIYNPLFHWGKIIDLNTMTLVAEISTPITLSEKHEQTYLPRFKQDYFTMAGYEVVE
jgi:hypothetical protein